VNRPTNQPKTATMRRSWEKALASSSAGKARRRRKPTIQRF
jgi:hypothetical protein